MRVCLALFMTIFLLCGFLQVVEGQPSSHLDAAFADAVIVHTLVSSGFDVLDATISDTGSHQFRVLRKETGEEFQIAGPVTFKEVPPFRPSSSYATKLNAHLADASKTFQIWIVYKVEQSVDGKTAYTMLNATIMEQGSIPKDGILVESFVIHLEGDTTLSQMDAHLARGPIGTELSIIQRGLIAKGSNRKLAYRVDKATKIANDKISWNSELTIADPDTFISLSDAKSWITYLNGCTELVSEEMTITFYGLDLATGEIIPTTFTYFLTDLERQASAETPRRATVRTRYVFEGAGETPPDELVIEIVTTIEHVDQLVRAITQQSFWYNEHKLSETVITNAVDPATIITDKWVVPPKEGEDKIRWLVSKVAGVTSSYLVCSALLGLETGGLGFLLCALAVGIGAEKVTEVVYDGITGAWGTTGTPSCDLHVDSTLCSRLQQTRSPQAMQTLEDEYFLHISAARNAEVKVRRYPEIRPLRESSPTGGWKGTLKSSQGYVYEIYLRISQWDPNTGSFTVTRFGITRGPGEDWFYTESFHLPSNAAIRDGKLTAAHQLWTVDARLSDSRIEGKVVFHTDTLYVPANIQFEKGTWKLEMERE